MELKTTCPWCRKPNELTSQVTDKGEMEHEDLHPSDGDFLMCMQCGMFGVFAGKDLRRPTRAEVIEIGLDDRVRAMRLAWRDIHGHA